MPKSRSGSAAHRMRSYIAGEKGRNRVRLFTWPSQGTALWVDFQEAGRRRKQCLGHADWDRAKRQADEIAARLGQGETLPQPARVKVLTCAKLFDMYEREVTEHKNSASARGHDRRTLKLFRRAFGEERDITTLNVRDWDSYIRRRRSGELAPPPRRKNAKVKPQPVRLRVIEQDLKLLLAVLNWAERARADGSGYLLDRNPLRGLKVPKDPSTRRPMFTPAQVAALQRAADEHSGLAKMLVMLCYYTGHRGGAIRQLRWSDIHIEAGTIRWRGEIDKIGNDHTTPMHKDLAAYLKAERKRVKAIGDVWVCPHPYDAEKPMSREYAVKKLWPALRSAAGIPAGEHYGWHSFRRTWTNQLRAVPLKELQTLGGWKSTQTIVQVYLQADEGAQRAALAHLASNR